LSDLSPWLALAGLGGQDRRAGFEIRGFDRYRQAPPQAGFQPRFEVLHLARITVAGEDDLLLAVEQGIEGVEELFLRAVLAGKKLDIVNQQGAGGAIVLLECFDTVMSECLYHFADKAFGMQIKHPGGSVLFVNQVARRMQQMSLAQSCAAVKQQGVIGHPRFLCDLLGGGKSQFVGFALNEVIEAVTGIQSCIVAFAAYIAANSGRLLAG